MIILFPNNFVKRFLASEPIWVPRQQRVEEEDRLPHLLFGFPPFVHSTVKEVCCRVRALYDWKAAR